MKFSALIGLSVLLINIQYVRATFYMNYEIILAIVIGELVFSFSLGIICILFSLNLLRAISENESIGDNLPSPSPFVISRQASAQDARKSNTSSDYHTFLGENVPPSLEEYASDDYELLHSRQYDFLEDESESTENEGGFGAAIRSFTNYLRLW
jgi:hypothetical protein